MAADLNAIREKVRRITRSPSESQLTDAQLDTYINTAILYDFPASVRLFPLRTTLTFYTQPNVDQYVTNSTNPLDPLYNFKNKYVAVHPPVYMAGVQGYYTQYRDVFYGYYPQTNTVADTLLRGNGGTGPFAGRTLGYPVLQNNVVLNALNAAGTAMILVDTPSSNTTGNLTVPNDGTVRGTINYITGQFTITAFPQNTLNGTPIYAEFIAYQPGKPIAMLYFNDTFTLRPVPDKSYPIQIEVDVRPTELLNGADIPGLEQWWQYIAMLASRLIFQDKMDIESLNMLMPMLKEQERFVLRTTLVQQANERTVTIYTQGKSYGLGWWGPQWPY